jgi:hypothetical protein
MPEQIDRQTFDAILNEFFPKAHRVRREMVDRWHDLFDLGCIRVRVSVLIIPTVKKGTTSVTPPGKVVVDLLGVRASIDGSEALLKRFEGNGTGGLRTALTRLRRDLIGVAAGILTSCGDERPAIAEDPDFPF